SFFKSLRSSKSEKLPESDYTQNLARRRRPILLRPPRRRSQILGFNSRLLCSISSTPPPPPSRTPNWAPPPWPPRNALAPAPAVWRRPRAAPADTRLRLLLRRNCRPACPSALALHCGPFPSRQSTGAPAPTPPM